MVIAPNLNFIHLYYHELICEYSRIHQFQLDQGHAAPILYAAWVEAGLLTPEDILALRSVNSDLEGHPTPVSVLNDHMLLWDFL